MPPPTWLPSAARKIWKATAPGMQESGRLTAASAELLGQFCAVVVELRSLACVIAKEGSLTRGLHGSIVSAAHVAASKLRGSLVSLSKSIGIDVPTAARLDASQPEPEVVDAVQAFIATRHRPEPVTLEEEEAKEAATQAFCASIGMK